MGYAGIQRGKKVTKEGKTLLLFKLRNMPFYIHDFFSQKLPGMPGGFAVKRGNLNVLYTKLKEAGVSFS